MRDQVPDSQIKNGFLNEGRSNLAVGGKRSAKGIEAAIEIARRTDRLLKVAAKVGNDQREYFDAVFQPTIDAGRVDFVGEADERQKNENRNTVFSARAFSARAGKTPTTPFHTPTEDWPNRRSHCAKFKDTRMRPGRPARHWRGPSVKHRSPRNWIAPPKH